MRYFKAFRYFAFLQGGYTETRTCVVCGLNEVVEVAPKLRASQGKLNCPGLGADNPVKLTRKLDMGPPRTGHGLFSFSSSDKRGSDEGRVSAGMCAGGKYSGFILSGRGQRLLLCSALEEPCDH